MIFKLINSQFYRVSKTLLKLKINLVYWYTLPNSFVLDDDTQTFELLKHGRRWFCSMVWMKSEKKTTAHFKANPWFLWPFNTNCHNLPDCRTRIHLEQFTEVEMPSIAEASCNKWFAATDPVKGNKFIQRLKENEPIQELATNPLLLCLVFERISRLEFESFTA